METVYVYAACDIAYASFYIYGLQALFGKRNVQYSFKKFPPFRQGTLAVIVVSDAYGTQKIGIDFHDRDDYIADLLDWCDVYGKINVNTAALPPVHRQKIVPIGPGFGIRLLNQYACIVTAFRNYLMATPVITNKKEHFSNYLYQYRQRLPLSSYPKETGGNDFLFFLSSIWKKEPQTNRFRANFIEAAAALPETLFEGGFAPRTNNDVPGFEQITVSKKYAFPVYLQKTQQSFAVFNTPAVLDCHGWKLGEFLRMGKAIISTPLTRQLPAPLQHGRDIHIVDGSKEAIAAALKQLKENPAYRHRLEENAYAYYLQYVEPVQVCKRLMAHPNKEQ